jgi:CheY-like chemotaxis protein/HPt (histidine-containing phosphotransfer) domain-containing protein
MNLKVVSGLLKETEINIDTATNGEDALTLVEENRYDLILLDHMMPVMDGIETLQCMRELKDFDINKTPVVMLTANAVVGAKDSYMQAGFTDYITKPIREEVLLSIVKKYLPQNLIVESESSDSKAAETVESPRTVGGLSEILDVATGLGYCMNDKKFYHEMLLEYVKNDRRSDLEKSFSRSDFDHYRIVIHSLKSTSLTIGAVKLSEMSKALENACKEGNFDFVREQHGICMADYKKILDKLSEYLAGGA